MLSGILPIDKPRGMTSHDVVAAVRRLYGLRAVGHTGTLDPDASGLLLLCLGKATRLAHFFEALEKTYWTVLRLGICTDTQDATGTVIRRCEVPSFTRAQVSAVCDRFRGTLQQIPPMYSAVKHQGERLYRLARQGKTVVRQARQIAIRRLEILDQRTPDITLGVTCSKGTYIRTLGEDIGVALGCGAHIVHLQRCRIGHFSLQQAYPLAWLEQQTSREAVLQAVMPVAEALAFLPSLRLTEQQHIALDRYRERTLSALIGTLIAGPQPATGYRLCTPSRETVAILQRQSLSSEKWTLYTPP